MISEIKNRLHPEMERVLTIFDELNVPDFYKGSAQDARKLFAELRPEPEVLPAIHQSEDHVIGVQDDRIRLRVYRPSSQRNLPALVWYHGGGWVFGDLNSGELACRELATRCGCVVVSVDYRLAPESRFPRAIDDCIAATQWVRQNTERLSIDARRIAVGGDSAGGNLAAAVAQWARDDGAAIVCQLLIYPITQENFTTRSYIENAEGYFLGKAAMQWFWDHYVPDVAERRDVKVSPLHGDLGDLSPAWIMTCGFDPLCDDGLLYADALEAAGIDVERYHRDDCIHGVFGMAIDPGSEARRQSADYLRRAFAVA